MTITDARARSLDEQLEANGFVVVRGLISERAVDAALRCLNLEIVRAGLTAEQIQEYKEATFFPHLRWEPEVLAVRDEIEAHVPCEYDELWGDAQLLLRFPDEAQDWPLRPHVDVLPEWAMGRRYRFIAGVALSKSSADGGCLAVWPGSHRGEPGEPHLVEMDAGDVIFLHRDLGHSSTLNRAGAIRYVVYFRRLTAWSEELAAAT